MPTNYASIKLSSEFVEAARREADVLHRSVGAQVEYWAKLGRAIEGTPGFNVETVRPLLEGQLRLENLPREGDERTQFLRQLSADLDRPDADTRSYFAALGARDGAVGTDGKGGVVRRQTSARKRRTA